VSPQTVEKCGCGFDSLPEYERGAQKEALRWKRKKEREREREDRFGRNTKRRRAGAQAKFLDATPVEKGTAPLSLWARAPLGAGLNALALLSSTALLRWSRWRGISRAHCTDDPQSAHVKNEVLWNSV
jgi:hypothetical protein